MWKRRDKLIAAYIVVQLSSKGRKLKTYDTNLKMSINWDRAATQQLIHLYRAQPCLYSAADHNSGNWIKKMESWNYIKQELNGMKPGVTVHQIKAKIKTLRTEMERETKKLILRSGAVADEVCTPQLWCYEELLFLVNCRDTECTKGESNLGLLYTDQSETSGDDDVEATSSNANGKRHLTPDKNINPKKINLDTSSEDMQQKVLDMMQNATNMVSMRYTGAVRGEDKFCSFICSELMRVKSDNVYERLKRGIFNLVTDALEEQSKEDTPGDVFQAEITPQQNDQQRESNDNFPSPFGKDRKDSDPLMGAEDVPKYSKLPQNLFDDDNL